MCIKCFEKMPMFYYNGDKYCEWQDDDFVRIGFSDFPDISNKLINKNVMSADEIKQAKKKPLILRNEVVVCLIGKRAEGEGRTRRCGAGGAVRDPFNASAASKQNNNVYVFTIPAGYDYDGASIPRFLWRFIGSKENIEFKAAALVHDVLCENHNYVDNNRYFADKVFESMLKAGDVSAFKRWLMFHSVDNYQKFCGWGEK